MALELELIAVAVGGLSTFVSAAATSNIFKDIVAAYLRRTARSKIKEQRSSRDETSVSTFRGSAAFDPASLQRFWRAQEQVAIRIAEAQALQRRQEASAFASKWSARALTFGQYVIGGVLASSFVQQKTSPEVIGIFGVLVLLASLITQHYHPEVTAEIAAMKAHQLEALVRESEDRVVVIESAPTSGDDDTKRLLDLLEKISAELKAITLSPSKTVPSRPTIRPKG